MYRESSSFYMPCCLASCFWFDSTNSRYDRIPKWLWIWRSFMCNQSWFVLAKALFHYHNYCIFLYTPGDSSRLVSEYSTAFGSYRRAGKYWNYTTYCLVIKLSIFRLLTKLFCFFCRSGCPRDSCRVAITSASSSYVVHRGHILLCLHDAFQSIHSMVCGGTLWSNDSYLWRNIL